MWSNFISEILRIGFNLQLLRLLLLLLLLVVDDMLGSSHTDPPPFPSYYGDQLWNAYDIRLAQLTDEEKRKFHPPPAMASAKFEGRELSDTTNVAV